jgi:RND family efflux transporter MFP subunit
MSCICVKGVGLKAKFLSLSGVMGLALALAGCQNSAPKQNTGMQGMPVQTATVSLSPVPVTSEYVATIKSRRSATLQPQVDGRLISISVKSGDHVKNGALLMEIDPAHQLATVASQRATERQKKAVLDYAEIEFARQQKLYEAGVSSHDTFDQARQANDNARADYESAVELRKTQEEQLAYYRIRAPFDGIIGDIPVHMGDYVSATTVLTTVDENRDLEAYIYLPTERAAEAHTGLGVDLLDTNDALIEKTKINFLSPQVDNALQGILAKAPVNASLDHLRTSQMIKARVVWRSNNMPTVPVLAIVRQGGQSFVYVVAQNGTKTSARQVAVTLGDIVEDHYSILSGLKDGDKVIVSGTQFLVDGMPVIPLGH